MSKKKTDPQISARLNVSKASVLKKLEREDNLRLALR
jgi:Mn-dependent DtxR family transcriptional regulator